MVDFELTEVAIDSLISGLVTAAALGVVFISGPNGQLVASVLGFTLIAIGVWRLYEVWNERDERPVMWVVLLAFGAVFEFGTTKDVIAILPLCALVDAAVIIVSTIVAFFEPIASKFGDILDFLSG